MRDNLFCWIALIFLSTLYLDDVDNWFLYAASCIQKSWLVEQPLFIYDLNRENHNNMGSTVDHDFTFQDIETQIYLFIYSFIHLFNKY